MYSGPMCAFCDAAKRLLKRNNLEKFFGKKIFLELFIKVKKNWRNDPSSLKKFGYN